MVASDVPSLFSLPSIELLCLEVRQSSRNHKGTSKRVKSHNQESGGTEQVCVFNGTELPTHFLWVPDFLASCW